MLARRHRKRRDLTLHCRVIKISVPNLLVTVSPNGHHSRGNQHHDLNHSRSQGFGAGGAPQLPPIIS
eukprot:1476582-Amphidinium_carterae.1